MLKKRLIFTLLIDNNGFVLSRNFRLQKVGNIDWLIKNYNFESISSSIDELIILNVSNEQTSIPSFLAQLDEIAKHCTIPIAVGGLINNLSIAESYMRHGADKLVLNTSCYNNNQLVLDLVNIYGSQAIIAAIDWSLNSSSLDVYSHAATKLEGNLISHLKVLQKLNIGEIYLNSIEKDGTGQGFSYDALNIIPAYWNKPIILAGGAGHYQHFLEALDHTNISAVATANLFNFIGNGLSSARTSLLNSNVNIAKFNSLLPYTSQLK